MYTTKCLVRPVSINREIEPHVLTDFKKIKTFLSRHGISISSPVLLQKHLRWLLMKLLVKSCIKANGLMCIFLTCNVFNVNSLFGQCIRYYYKMVNITSWLYNRQNIHIANTDIIALNRTQLQIRCILHNKTDSNGWIWLATVLLTWKVMTLSNSMLTAMGLTLLTALQLFPLTLAWTNLKAVTKFTTQSRSLTQASEASGQEWDYFRNTIWLWALLCYS